MRISYGVAASLRGQMNGLFAYRYAVFVQRLKWDIPGAMHDLGLEIDQFDRSDTLHILGRDDNGDLCGCARLLPTTRPYLLGSVFPELMAGAPVPEAEDTWEISRFSSVDLNGGQSRQANLWGCREVMAGAVACAMNVGARRLVGVSVIAIERILIRLGVDAYRMGPIMDIRGHSIFAFCLEINDKTLIALGLHHGTVINNRFFKSERLPYFDHVA